MLRNVDEKWQDHIDNMSHLKEGIHLRAYGQTNPVEAYKQESYDIFSDMTNEIKESVIRGIFKVKYNTQNTADTVSKLEQSINTADNFSQSNFGATINNSQPPKREPVRVEKTVGRNEPCPCGSGKKYKQCCGK
jgi:preprotein translocase subunit SecA